MNENGNYNQQPQFYGNGSNNSNNNGPYYNGNNGNYGNQPNVAEVMTVKNWLLTNFILMIPIVNIIMLFVWGFGSNTNPNKANYAKASLILAAIGIGLYIILFVVIFGFVISNLDNIE
ncbi:hypothetical protein PaecuDRAFT_1114 [Paenibacillus curdlanolyticus YK9]|uniref:Uncharacterized protein n=1 Tax=Paenibacillus curdlanolyticus YK9 TaxID=717606 RepID=E0I642_9BACL|nr:hypothetical protein [Paenibacillus curdlanolyticus]EFM12434.1 hypothetical protein PaecuDRAFT_1114 [Paenibacillus curdlanolyticus YK9]